MGRVQHYFPSKDDLLTGLIPATHEDRRLFRVAQAFETHALTQPELAERLRQGYDELIGLLTALGSDRAAELLALALGLANLTLTGNLTPEEARATLRSGIEKHRRGAAPNVVPDSPNNREDSEMSGKRIRQFHRVVSMIFMATVVFTAVALTVNSSAVWVSYIPLLPLFVLMGTGVYMWFLPSIARRRARRTSVA